MNPGTFRYILKENFVYSKVRLVSGQKSVEARVDPYPLFTQAKEIQLKEDQYNNKCLELIQNGSVEIAPQKSREFVKRCRDVFGLKLELDAQQVGLNLMVGNNDQDIKILDMLEIGDLFSVVKIAFDKSSTKLHSKLLRKLKNYAKSCKRQASQKLLLQNLVKAHKEAENIEQDGEVIEKNGEQAQPKIQAKKMKKQLIKKPQKVQNDQELMQFAKLREAQQQDSDEISSQTDFNKIKKQQSNIIGKQDQNWNGKIKGKNRGRRNRRQSRQGRSSSKRQLSKSKDRQFYERGMSTSKEKVDPKILLGINGDTQFGWRQRNRPPRIPVRNHLEVGEQNIPPLKKQAPKKRTSQFAKQAISKATSQKKQLQLHEIKSAQPKLTTTSDESASKLKPIKREEKKEIKEVFQQPNEKETKILKDPTITQDKQMKLIYTFPKNGKNFNFKKLKEQFIILLNGSIWVKYNNGTLTIIKGENGYIRETKIDPLDDGFMAQGFTLKLDGNSNIEDGGDTIGNPTIQQFTGSSSQFFHVTSMEVYVPKQINV